MRDNRTGKQRRADNRAAIASVVEGALASDRCDRSARALWAARLEVTPQHIDDVVAARKALHGDVLIEGPRPVLDDVVQLLIGEARVVVDLPDAVETPDSLALLARMVREHNAAVEALVSAIADGTITTDEGTQLAEAARRSLAVTAAVEQLGKRAARNHGVRLTAVAGGKR